jgi:AhpD family alkylhydroperoxidase
LTSITHLDAAHLHHMKNHYIGSHEAISGRPAMSKDYKAITAHISRQTAKLREDIPDTMKAFGAMASAATRDGALDKKTKELIALALGVAAHCDGCIGFHLQSLKRLGATLPEVEEALGMAIYMGGGPSLMYAAEALHGYQELMAA